MSEQRLPAPDIELAVTARFDVRTEIPATSSGRTVDALTDIIRPISEALGLVGDKIRLQREKTWKRIAQIASERIASSEEPPHPIPNKFLVPLIEKASLEDPHDQKLIEMWANLLATAATGDIELLGQYVGILSEITSPQVKILEEMLSRVGDAGLTAGNLVDNYYYLNRTGLPGSICNLDKISDVQEFGARVVDVVNLMGVIIDTFCAYYEPDSGDDFTISAPDGIYSDDKYYDFENLCRMGVIERTEVKRHRVGRFSIDLHYYIVTPIGVDLYACCNPKKLQRERTERLALV